MTREDRLLDLARVVRPADHDLGAGRMEDDERLPPRAVLVGNRRDGRRVQDERLGSISSSSSSVGSMKSVFANSACQGLAVTTRTAMR